MFSALFGLFCLYFALKKMDYLSTEKEKIFICVLVVLMILLAGLRIDYGKDIYNYQRIFARINSVDNIFNEVVEPGFAAFIFFFKKMNFGFSTFTLAVAAVSIFLKFITFKKISPMPIVSLFLYFLLFYLTQETEQIRHGLAISICFFSIVFILEKKPIHFICSIVIASTFHYTALIFFPCYLMTGFKDTYVKWLIVLFTTAVLFSTIDVMNIFAWLNNSFINSSYFAYKISIYSGNRLPIISITLFMRIIIFCVYALYCNHKEEDNLYINMYGYGMLLYIVFSSVGILAARFSIYFRVLEVVMFPKLLVILNEENCKKKKIIIATFVVFMFLYYVLKFFLRLSEPAYYIYHSV